MIQVHIFWSQNQGTINEELRIDPLMYPKREIMNVSVESAQPEGWFVIITYKLN
jgi:hypothetical protein